MDAHAPGEFVLLQLGAREHYALPRALHAQGRLRALLTDAWAPPGLVAGALTGALAPRLAQRHHPALRGATVHAFTASLAAFEARERLLPPAADPWPRILRRNEWFQDAALRAIRRHGLLQPGPHGRPPVLFAYSYAARRVLAQARRLGCTTVLGQIDPGPLEAALVEREAARWAGLRPAATRIPPRYWRLWRQEVDAADLILANSRWSERALRRAGVPAGKILVAPLIHEPPAAPPARREPLPRAFTAARPLRVLFLGSLIVRKGIAQALEAVELLRDAPVEWSFVGAPGVEPPASLRDHPRFRWRGSIPRAEVDAAMRRADVFLFPTLSDGFGLVQLEARAAGLPVIASRRCGAVVRDGQNGLLLPEVTGPAIASTIQRLLDDAPLLARLGQPLPGELDPFRPGAVLALLHDALARLAP